MAKTASTQGILGTITTKPIDGGGLAVKVTYSFLAKGKSRSALMDLLGMQEQTVEVAVTAVQGSLALGEE